MKQRHTVSFQDWPCNLYKFYKMQGALGHGNQPASSSSSTIPGKSEREASFTRELCNPCDWRLWAKCSLHISSTGREFTPCQRSDVPLHWRTQWNPSRLSPDPLSPEEESPEPAQGVCSDSQLPDHVRRRGAVLRWNSSPRKWNTILTWSGSGTFKGFLRNRFL